PNSFSENSHPAWKNGGSRAVAGTDPESGTGRVVRLARAGVGESARNLFLLRHLLFGRSDPRIFSEFVQLDCEILFRSRTGLADLRGGVSVLLAVVPRRVEPRAAGLPAVRHGDS